MAVVSLVPVAKVKMLMVILKVHLLILMVVDEVVHLVSVIDIRVIGHKRDVVNLCDVPVHLMLLVQAR